MINSKVDFNHFNSIFNSDELKNWIIDFFEERLGVETLFHNEENFRKIKFTQGSNVYYIHFSNKGFKEVFNGNITVNYITSEELSKIYNIKLSNDNLVFFGDYKKSEKIISLKDNNLYINYDFISYFVWTVNRLEEYGVLSDELHNRFELGNSHLKHDELFKRAIIDEWFSFFRSVLILNNFKISNKRFSFSVSHDVDIVSKYKAVPLSRLIPNLILDLVQGNTDYLHFLLNQKKYLDSEHSNTFKWLMEVSEKFKIKSRFYFITGNTSLRYDYVYRLKSKLLFSLIKQIHEKKHKIGIHYSYNASKKNKISKEWNRLKAYCDKLNIKPEGGRMHYLKINFLETLYQLESTNQIFDNTLTFHESGGFRCGTSLPYYPFDVFNLRKINIKIHPLIVMEGSILDYSNIKNLKMAFSYIKNLIDQCYINNGNFSLLWHNSDLETDDKKQLYFDILNYCSLKNKQISKTSND